MRSANCRAFLSIRFLASHNNLDRDDVDKSLVGANVLAESSE